MSLEARVDALEHDMAALRAETRGWASYAVAADQKAATAGELLSLIRQDVNDIKTRVTGHTQTLDGHTQILNGHTETLDGHTQILNGHTETLDGHTQILNGHTETLDGHTQILNGHTETLNEHGQMLREILDRLS
jgi:ABC-type transporter Mla subunit MlaD